MTLFDTQHRAMMDLINDLDAAVVASVDPEVKAKVFSDLVAVTVHHFATEESLFREIHYPEADRHTAWHHKLRKELAVLASDVASGRRQVDMDLIHWLEGWFVNHVMDGDRPFAQAVLSAFPESSIRDPAR